VSVVVEISRCSRDDAETVARRTTKPVIAVVTRLWAKDLVGRFAAAFNMGFALHDVTRLAGIITSKF
jgi:hypothetical protein